MKVRIFKNWKKTLTTKSFFIIPTIAFLKNPKYKSFNIMWLWWDIMFEF